MTVRVEVIQATPDPERLVWICAHQDYAATFAMDDPVPKDPGAAIVKNLLQRGHYGPFEHPQISFNIGGISRACLAQLTRHRIGVTFDVQSHRYTKVDQAEPTPEYFVFPPYLAEGARAHARGMGRVELDDPARAEAIMQEAYAHSLKAYNLLLAAGMPPEDARLVLPEGVRINLTMSVNARALMHILDMRLPPNAQWEIRMLCERLLELAEDWMPATFRWYRENRAYKHKLAP
ncbi:MAG TPA: FAD-dependent thymidylate synthase [Sphingobacteriaceae bacterium]|nr:FAD-dependent thymidylate synthase [Sphingobacteriaceae bacterium]